MQLKYSLIISLFIGAAITASIYEYYFSSSNKLFDEIYSHLELTSESAFNDLEPASSMFVQVNNSILIHNAMEYGLIDED